MEFRTRRAWLPLLILAVIFPDGVTAQPDILRHAVHAQLQASSFEGVLAISRGNTTIYVEAFGTANRESGWPITVNTEFQIGSISKWFTVIAALRLIESGRLDLYAPIGRYLDNYPAEVGKRVRVVDVLSNMSGIKDRLPTELINEPAIAASRLTAAQAVRVYARGPLTFQPGTQFDYSHTNWLLAQAIVERAGGAPLEQLLHQVVFEPLGLKSTGVTHGRFGQVPGQAIAYNSAKVDAPRELHVIPNFLVSTGTIYSNCHDLIRAAHLIYNSGFLTASSLKSLNTIRWQPEYYAIGGRIKSRSIGGSKKMIAFEIGSFGGFKALVEHVIGDDVTIVALNNLNMDEDRLAALGDTILETAYAKAQH